MNPRRAIPVLRFVAPLVLAVAGSASAYDPPDFATELFSSDGIFLAVEDRSSLLEALSAIASNFPNPPRVDDDLREKSLVLALRIDPLHASSRAAHRQLAAGTRPEATSHFKNLDDVSETLWTLGRRLREPPLDPEEVRLAPFLLELSLLVHPEPPQDRLAEFAIVCSEEAPAWGPALILQSDGNPSTARASSLFRQAREVAEANQRAALAATPVRPQTPSRPQSPPLDAARPPQPPRTEPLEPISASLATVRQVSYEDSSKPVGGLVSLAVRSPLGTMERSWLEEQRAASVPFPLLPLRDGVPLEPLEAPTSVQERKWAWPPGALGEVKFVPMTPLPGPRRLTSASALLPSLLLVDSVLGKREVNESFVLLGEIDPASMQPSFPGDPVAIIETAAALNRPYLLAPASALDPLVTSLQVSGRPELLLKNELVSYEDFDGAVALLTSPIDPALAAARAVLDEIETASAKMPLPELLRLPSAQDRLRAILASCPSHLSARALLEYATRPLTEEMHLAQFMAKVDEIAAPFMDPEEDSITFNGATLQDLFERTDSSLLKLRNETPPQAKNLLGLAEDLVQASKIYLQFTNKGSSLASQRLREAKTAIAAYQTERSKFEPAQ